MRETVLTAGAPRTTDRVLGLCFLAVAFEGRLLAAGALGFGSADAGLAGALAAGSWDSHGGFCGVGSSFVVGVFLLGMWSGVRR